MDIFLWTVAVALLLQLLFVIWNLTQLPQLGGNGRGRAWLDGEETSILAMEQDAGVERREEIEVVKEAAEMMNIKPRLSVLIPARDEAMNIAACLRSVLVEPSPHLEVLVLDDRSTDGTADAARHAAAGDPRVRVLPGAALPPGWLGKSHACHQLAEAARGEWWLFLDADARLAPTALAAALDTALAQGQGLVTGFPLQETGTWMEKLIVPMMSFSIACHLPIRLVRQSADPKFVAAHGAFLLIAAESYRATGGHAGFKSHLVDDMQLASAVKKAGLPVTLADVRPHISMRMYQDDAGVWNGYKKNIFAGLGRNSLILTFMLTTYGLLYLLPPLMLLICISVEIAISSLPWQSNIFLPSLLGYLIGVCIKAVIDRGSGQPWWLSFFLPASICLLTAIALASWLASFTGKGYEWKGRRYS
ncbi:glycosyl hydrolase [Paenibacillus marchantiophytorum]|uniref:4,4'-diaponeurosporenoate glycosyltransferase n=1 Tax=Paenibacillus marchantiophytorum TaxID=1619310 RepID=A0ABQ1EN17_9BACL|nr:glycosyltransferase family 2 protein [Paenibacillus marchantiophytorum]GFZ79381.1 glycosyl hydrolase [Paenibacillus marchantiophytorum]